MNQVQESVLFRTSAASDVQCSNGVLTVAGLSGTKKSRISSIVQVTYKAEVAQVKTVGASAYTPTGSTSYKILIGDTNRTRNGASEPLVSYGYTTPATITDLGATAALQREAIHLALVAAINADTKNFVTAASLLTGSGISITDDAGYYPAFSQTGTGRLGASTVLPVQNSDDSGFLATNTATTTAAVYASGAGADLLAGKPVTDALYGGLLSGYLKGSLNGIYFQTNAATPLPPVSGQNYDIFVISSLADSAAHNQRGQLALIPKMQAIAVDNGTGTSTTNLAGFLTFEREILKHAFDGFTSDPSAVVEWFDKGYVMQANPGVSPYTGTLAGTADVMHFFTTPYGTKLEQYNINTQTIFAPLEVDAGLRIEQDVNATDGAHYCGGTLALAPNAFIVGKTPFSVNARVIAGDWTDAFLMVGFRKKAVYAADYTTYDDLGAIGTQVSAAGDFVATQGNINNGTTVETVSASTIAADSVSVTLTVKVDTAGAVTAFRNGVSFPIYSVGTTALVFDAGDEMIPYFQFINRNSSASTLTFGRFIAVASTDVIV